MNLKRFFSKDFFSSTLLKTKNYFDRDRLAKLRLRSLILLAALGVNLLAFYLFPVLNYLQNRARNKPVTPPKRDMVIQTVNMNEEKKEKKKLRIREAKPQKVTAKAESSRFALKLGVANGEGVAVSEGDTGAVVYNEGEVDSDPIPLQQILPKKPQAAEAAGVSGEVEVEFVIDETGKVISVKVLNSTEGYGFKEATVNAIWSWRYKPALYKKIPVRVRRIQPVKFS
jgi:TonB family protein